MKRTRRSILKASAGAAAAGAVAGCLSEVGFGGNEGGYAAFFTLHDWAEAVSGDELAFENPVDVGEMGHGWSPGGDLLSNVATSEIFVYLDSPEFSWAQDVADALERDYEDVVVVDGLEGVDLLPWDHDHDPDEGAGDDQDHEEDGEDDHERDGSAFDPHVWVDPVRAKRIVGNIADGLVDVAPGAEGTFEENAAAYEERLDELDRRFRELVDEAERRVAVLGGHDSYQYLEDRYGFEIHSPTGVSPERSPSPGEIADTIDLVNDAGIDVVLYDHFESPALAETIVENSHASEVVAVTPAEATTRDWNERGWGYVEQMQEINLPAFEKALGSP